MFHMNSECQALLTAHQRVEVGLCQGCFPDDVPWRPEGALIVRLIRRCSTSWRRRLWNHFRWAVQTVCPMRIWILLTKEGEPVDWRSVSVWA